MAKRNIYQLCRNEDCPYYPAATTGYYCNYCRPLIESMRNRDHYRNGYTRRAKEVVDAAREVETKCYLCPNIMLPHEKLSAHHINPGDRDSMLVATHWLCNVQYQQG